MPDQPKSALVVGASSGTGRAVWMALAARGYRTWGAARSADRIQRIAREAAGNAVAVVADATEPDAARTLLEAADPSIVVIALGASPHMASLDGQTWESFSLPWNVDVKATVLLCQEALRKPLRPGSTVVVVSSGAALNGSPLSGGYAGAKRMQWFVAQYAQRLADAGGLGIRFVTAVPRQFIAGTPTGASAAAAYAARANISETELIARQGGPFTPEALAAHIVELAIGEPPREGSAFGIDVRGVAPL